jgi:diguanylate cyclase (GGDEF)-like protein
LRWVYPLVGAVVAGTGTALLSTLRAEPVYVAVAATSLFVALGWLLGQKEDWLRETAATDPLTGVANRRCFDQRLGRAVAESMRSGTPITLLFVDVDQLKGINDELGHAAGDAALKLVGDCLARTCRSRDLVARWGGDEFVILAMWTTGREGLILAQRVRETLARVGQQLDAEPLPTVSIGVAELQPDAPRPEALLLAADEALYQAKLGGRDRAVLAPATLVVRRRTPPMSRLKTRPLRTAPDSSRSDWPRGRGEPS